MSYAIGIDLGTVYSCVGVIKDGHVEIIANSQGNKITPSVVGFTDRDRKVGDVAKSRMADNPENTIYGMKS
jgi:molecular chaperone DnaK (HSP70)